jgi:hypothetical protein
VGNVVAPLKALHNKYGESCGASDAMAAYVSALETPVAAHESTLSEIPGSARTNLVVQLALCELGGRRKIIRALREKAYTKEDDGLDAVFHNIAHHAEEGQHFARRSASPLYECRDRTVQREKACV